MSRALRSSLLGLTLAGLAIISCLAPPAADAQAVSGTILGTVKDSSGAVVPGATVTVLNTRTGFSRSIVTDTHGEFNAPSIPTGTYSVTAEISGFKKVSKTNVLVGVDQKVRIDVALEIGGMEEIVEIQAETPLLNTASSDLGQTIVEEQIRTLPLNGRNFVSLTRTVPGVLRGIPGANIDGAGSLAWRASAAFSAMGQRPRDNNYMLDGVDNNETWLQTVVIFPSVDALDEFKLQTSTYSAEFGRSLGGVVNLQIKSGTNDFHGSVFEFLRNDAFDANNFFNNRAGIAKAPFSQHQFGATFGGPIIKDKTFFFADYQGLRIEASPTYLSTVPTVRMRNGDFGELNRRDLRPAHRPALPGQRHPAESPGSGVQEHHDAALPRAEHGRHHGGERAAGQQLPDQPHAHARGQPVRRQGRPPADDEQPLLRPLQLPEDAPRPAGDARARRRGRHLRRGRRQHQGAERHLQRHAHVLADADQRVPLRLELDQVLHDAARLR